MLRSLKNTLYKKDFSTKNSVGLYLDSSSEGLKVFCVSRGVAASQEPICFEYLVPIDREDFNDSELELNQSLLFFTFSSLEFKLFKMRFENLPKKESERKKFILWRLSKEWGLNEEQYQINIFTKPLASAFEVEVHACSKQVNELVRDIAAQHKALVVESKPQVVRLVENLILSRVAEESVGFVFYLQKESWSIVQLDENSEINYLRTQASHNIYVVEQAFRDLELLYQSKASQGMPEHEVIIVYDSACHTDIRSKVEELRNASDIPSAERKMDEENIEFSSWQMRCANHAIY